MSDYYYITAWDSKGIPEYCPSHRDTLDSALSAVEQEQCLDAEVGLNGMVYIITPRKIFERMP